MATTLVVTAPGPQTTLQDLGRRHARRHGVPLGGAADADAHRLALAVAGAASDAATLEFRLIGPTVAVAGGPVRAVVGGPAPATLRRADGAAVAVSPWHSVTLADGDTLAIGLLDGAAVGYLALAPAPDVPIVMGGRGTALRTGFGGLEGRALAAGDRLALAGPAPTGGERRAVWRPDSGPLRVIPGPQADHFTEAGLATFLSAGFVVAEGSDRMGVRLGGPVIAHSALGPDIMSEGLVPGSVQVPGSGQPILLGVDAQTIGGYPKIATVIAADLPRIGRLVPGQTVRFAAVDAAGARAALAQAEARLAAAVAAIAPAPAPGGLDPGALWASNLLSGKVDALRPDHFPDALDPDQN